MATPTTLIERFRHWYDYERDCNAKVIAMVESVPEDRRGSDAFTKAVGKASHIIAARHMWMHRLGESDDRPENPFPTMTVVELPGYTARVEALWTAYLARVTEDQVVADIEWVGPDGKRRRAPLANVLTQIFGHAWYHRGQIAMLVKEAGGTPMDTDYIYWDRPTIVEEHG